jgi:uncharacterized protein
MAETQRLLDLQAIDLAIDRLDARRRALESGAEVTAARERANEAEGTLGELRLRLEVFDRDAARFEHEIDSIARKTADEEQRLYDGSVANAKELEAIQHEVANLKRRKEDREDELLALMEQREELQALAVAAEREATELRAQVDRALGDAAGELTSIASELENSTSERASAVQGIDPELLELYEDLRRQKKGVAAVALVDGVCQGCHEQLSSVEQDRVKRTAGVPRCEYCRRILVL